MVLAWEKDKKQPNPYLNEKTGMVLIDPFLRYANLKVVPTEAEIRLRLQEDERRTIVDGSVQLHEMSATSLLATGLMLEESQ
jgi:hypothetical protein